METKEKKEITPAAVDAASPEPSKPAYEIVGIEPGLVYVIALHKTVDLRELTPAQIAELKAVKYPHLKAD